MAFVVIQCDDVSLLKRFLVAVSFSSVSSSLLTQLPFEHALLSINENNYLLVPDTVPPEIVCLLPAVQKQIVIQVRGLESCLVSVTIHGGHVKDDYFSEHGRLCLITLAGVDLNIFLIERNVSLAQKDDVLPKDDIAADRNFSVLILTEWAMRNASKSIGTNSGSATLSPMAKIGTISDCQMNSQEVRLAIARSLRIDHGECRNPSKQSPRWREGTEGSGVLSKKGVPKLKVQSGSFPSSSISSAKDGDYLRNNGSDAPKRNLEISSPTAKKRHDSDAVRRDTLNTKGDFGSNRTEKEMQMLDGESARSHGKDGAYIPSIALTLLSRRSFRPMKANSPKPIPFENDVFVGKLLLLVNTKPICDQYLKRFEGHQYTFDMQVQGKFKCIPKGNMFMGAEITKKMELGLFTKGICGSILQVVRAVNPYLHHSFGDNKDYELPHIVGPMWSLFDRLEITPPGGSVPELGGLLDEDGDKRAKRRKTPNFIVDVSTENTYSMSFKTSSIELVDWTIVKVPVMGVMDLHTFWGDADVRLVAYMVPDQLPGVELGSNGLPKAHPQKSNSYLFSIDVKHDSNHPEMSVKNSTFLSDSYGVHSPGSSERTREVVSERRTEVRSKKKFRSNGSPSIRLAPSRQFHSVYQDRDSCKDFINEADSERKCSDGDGDGDGDDDEEHSPPSYESSDEEDDEDEDEDDDDDEEKFFSAEEGEEEEITGAFSQSDRRVTSGTDRTGSSKDLDRDSSSGSDHNRKRDSEIPKRGKLADKIPPFLRGFSQRSSSRASSPKGRKGLKAEDPNFYSSLVLATVEVDERRVGRPTGRRFLYAFLQNPPSDEEGVAVATATPRLGSGSSALTVTDSSAASIRAPTCTLKSYKEWTSEMPKFDQITKPCNFKRMSEVGRRRFLLNQWYNLATLQGKEDPSMKFELQKFLLVTRELHDIHEIFLTKCPSGLLNGLQAKRLRTGLAPFLMDSLVCVQVGNYHWSEECLGLTVGDLIFVKHSNRLRGAVRLCLPLNTILSVRSCGLNEVSIAIPDCFPMIVSTFSRKYAILLRGEENRNKWVAAISTANPLLNESCSVPNALSYSQEPEAEGLPAVRREIACKESTGDESNTLRGNSSSAVLSMRRRRHSDPHVAFQPTEGMSRNNSKSSLLEAVQQEIIAATPQSIRLALPTYYNEESEPDPSPTPSPLPPFGGSAVTVVQMPSSRMNWNIVNSYSSPQQTLTKAQTNRARHHSNSVDMDTRLHERSSEYQAETDRAEVDDINMKRTASFLKILSGKGKGRTPPSGAERNSFPYMTLFKRKKNIGMGDASLPPSQSNSLFGPSDSVSHGTASRFKDKDKDKDKGFSSSSSSGESPHQYDSIGKDYGDRPSRLQRSMTMGSAPLRRPEIEVVSDPTSAVSAYRNRPRSYRPEGLSAINTTIPLIGHSNSKSEARDRNSARSAIPSPASTSSSHPSPAYHPKHLDLLVKPKGWILGDKLILNARSFTRESSRCRNKGGGKDGDLSNLLDRPHLLVAALLKLAFELSTAVNEEPPDRPLRADTKTSIRSVRSNSPLGSPREAKTVSPSHEDGQSRGTADSATRSLQASLDDRRRDSTDQTYDSNGKSSVDEVETDAEIASHVTTTNSSSSNNNSNSNSNSNSNKRNSYCKLTGNANVTGGNGFFSNGSSGQPMSPLGLSDDPHHDFMTDEVQSLWIGFMNGVSLLQAADVSQLDPKSDEALCMFLNLYHLMVLHSSLVMGPPCTAYKWMGFFGCVSYEVFGDFMSIAELEHCILRNDMSRPKVGIFAKHIIPQTRFAFALHRKDVRLLWAINCGSYSMLPMVPIYEPHLLEQQLDAVMRLSMPTDVTVCEKDNGTLSVTLPMTCQWFAKDVEEAASLSAPAALTVLGAPSPSVPSSATYRHPLMALVKYCRGAQHQAVSLLLSKKTSLSTGIKYAPFAYRCRFFHQLTEADMCMANKSDP